MVKLIVAISKGLIREQKFRRHLMFYVTIVALLLLFFGSAVFDRWLREHPFVLLLWWLACAWTTLLAMLLALFDLLVVRAAAKRAERDLRKRILEEGAPDDEGSSP